MPRWAELAPLRPKALGTSDTINLMHQMVAEGKLDPLLTQIAHAIRLQCPGNKSWECQARAVFDYLKKNGVFVRHPHQIQRIDSPRALLENMARLKDSGSYKGKAIFTGDCPHYSIMAATLGGILGFPYRFETVIADLSRPDEYSHVYTALNVPGKGWVGVDASTDDAYFGWRPPVSKNKIRSWPEPDIDSVMTPQVTEKTMSRYRLNGYGLSGVGLGQRIDDPADDILPVEFFETRPAGYGMENPAVYGDSSPEFIETLYPMEPAIPEDDFAKPPLQYLQKWHKREPYDRSPMTPEMVAQGLRPTYQDAKPGVSNVQPGYPLNYLNGPFATSWQDYHPAQPGVSLHEFRDQDYRFRRTPEINEGEPMHLSPRGITGMGALPAEGAGATPAAQTVTTASESMWESIVKNVVGAAGGILTTQAQLQLAKAQADLERQRALTANNLGINPNTLAPLAPPAVVLANSKPWWSEWYVWGPLAAIAGFGLYKMVSRRRSVRARR